MKIKISYWGCLEIERSPGHWVDQHCRFAPTFEEGDLRRCSHDCPQFGDPQYSPDNPARDTLRICQERVLVGEIIDERPQEPEKAKLP